ncbi:unnamed protein product, partial [Protopolystoma xenopodis]
NRDPPLPCFSHHHHHRRRRSRRQYLAAVSSETAVSLLQCQVTSVMPKPDGGTVVSIASTVRPVAGASASLAEITGLINADLKKADLQSPDSSVNFADTGPASVSLRCRS